MNDPLTFERIQMFSSALLERLDGIGHIYKHDPNSFEADIFSAIDDLC